MKTLTLSLWSVIVLSCSITCAPLQAARLSSDFSQDANPSNGWQFGYKVRLQSEFALYRTRYEGTVEENTQAYWGWISDSESWVRQNLGPNEFTVPSQGTFPVHAVSVAPGYPEREDNYAVVRYVIPSDGRYRVAIWAEATGGSDVDVHVRRDDLEWVGKNLNPGETLGFTNEQYYASGTILEIATGRGDDGSNYGAVLQLDAQIDSLNQTLIPFSGGLASQFPSTVQPTNCWSLGYKTSWDGDFMPYTERFSGEAYGNELAYWGRVANTESFIRKNQSSNAFTVAGQGTFPAHGISAAPGPFGGVPDNYAVAQYRVPADGNYRFEVFGYASGWSDVDVHITQDGVELLGRNLVAPQEIHLNEQRFLVGGTLIEVAIGRGADQSNYGAIFQFDMQVELIAVSNPGVPEIVFAPARGPFLGETMIHLTNRLGVGLVHYTLDGSVPTARSHVYTGPFKLRQSTLVRAAVFVDGVAASQIYLAAYRRDEPPNGGIASDWLIRHFGVGFLDDPKAKPEADPDSDGSSNLREYASGSDPRDPLSGFSLRIKSAPCVLFSSVPGQTYRILRRSRASFETVEIGLVTATSNETSFVDTSLAEDAGFYTVEAVR
ncbi:MAG: chitobiase/beta-hexosaminidase C-terminal domain-containing protein [Verrucomicrobiales bacterium]|nr:chitobiase/beta-hexosaminidase C-terminal domain-containing protein [Verrucomicrobiales bacterium]